MRRFVMTTEFMSKQAGIIATSQGCPVPDSSQTTCTATPDDSQRKNRFEIDFQVNGGKHDNVQIRNSVLDYKDSRVMSAGEICQCLVSVHTIC